jgi:hypothetical protein
MSFVTMDTIFTAIFEADNSITNEIISSFQIYPNPAQNYICIALPDDISSATLTLYNLKGNTIFTEYIYRQKQIDIRHLVAGSYICYLISGNR